MKSFVNILLILPLCAFAALLAYAAGEVEGDAQDDQIGLDNLARNHTGFDRVIRTNSRAMLEEGRHTFRFDTFGDEAFWGQTLKLHQAIKGARLGGIGSGLSPRAALAL